MEISSFREFCTEEASEYRFPASYAERLSTDGPFSGEPT